MMLLRTVAIDSVSRGSSFNGALLCSFAIPKIACNFLVYSLDEGAEGGNSRVYIAKLCKKSDKYFLMPIDSASDLGCAVQVFKQVVRQASGTASAPTEPDIDFHFIDLQDCKLLPARLEDHHALTVKKALVMKVLSRSDTHACGPAIESTAVIVPSIRFSSVSRSSGKPSSRPDDVGDMHTPATVSSTVERSIPATGVVVPLEASTAMAQVQKMLEPDTATAVTVDNDLTDYEQPEAPIVLQAGTTSERVVERAQASTVLCADADDPLLLDMESSLSSLAVMAKDLARRKLGAVKHQQALEVLRDGLQEKSRQLAEQEAQLRSQQEQLELGRAANKKNVDKQAQLMADRSAALQQLAQELRAKERGLEQRSENLLKEETRLLERNRQMVDMKDKLCKLFSELDDGAGPR